MEKLFLPLDLTLAIQNLERFHRIEEIGFWDQQNEISFNLFAHQSNRQVKIITWEQAFDVLLVEAIKELDYLDIYLRYKGFESVKLFIRKSVFDDNAEELASGKEDCFYKFLELLKLA